MATLQFFRFPLQFSFSRNSYFSLHHSNPSPFKNHRSKSYLPKKSNSRFRGSGCNFTAAAKSKSSVDESDNKNSIISISKDNRPPFDLNLAIVLAGFAFEAYYSPPKDVVWREKDVADCQTIFLSEKFLREMYDGQIFVKLKKGEDLPALDPWGTSDPYVVFQLEDQNVKSNVKWAMKKPIWNEEFSFNIKTNRPNILQVAAWDANLVAPHKRMGNAEIRLESLCDGNLHEIVVELEGNGSGGKIYLEVKYKSYDEINKEKNWWNIPLVSDFLMKSSLGSALNVTLGSESINVSDFVQSAFGQLKPLYNNFLPTSSDSYQENNRYVNNSDHEKEDDLPVTCDKPNESVALAEKSINNDIPSDDYFWKTFTETINQSVLQKIGVSLPEIKLMEGFDLLNKMSVQSQKNAEEEYIQSGLATPVANQETNGENNTSTSNTVNTSLPSFLEIRKASLDVVNQTETILGAMMVLASNISQQNNDSTLVVHDENKAGSMAETDDNIVDSSDKPENIATEVSALDSKNDDEKKMFSSAESAMEAWTMLATSLGQNSFIKSDFEKICFLDNATTDTQVALWRDLRRRRVIVAFRGTEQSQWKDLRTDLMILPVGLNPETLGGECKKEVQVHSGFLNAYESVKNRIMTLIKLSIGYSDDVESMEKWHVYITGHSLGGALATLLALELSSSRMAKDGAISVTMYNFGSPRVGNKWFAEVYNEKVKDSWRVVNHRDIVPSIPRLMGYCHVAQPVFLVSGKFKEAMVYWCKQEMKHGIANVYTELERSNHAHRFPWHNRVWTNYTTAKDNLMLWKTLRGGLNTMDRLNMLGMSTLTTCMLCNDKRETIKHLFFECRYSCYLWEGILAAGNFHRKGRDNKEEWLLIYRSTRWRNGKSKELILALKRTINLIWYERNERLFNNREMTKELSLWNVKKQIKQAMENSKYAFDNQEIEKWN